MTVKLCPTLTWLGATLKIAGAPPGMNLLET